VSSEADVILKLLQGKSSVRVLPGFFRGFDTPGGRMLVEFDKGNVPAHPVTPWRPKMNEPVWVQIVDGVAYVLGPTVNPPADGVVVGTGSGIAVISTDIGDVDATYNSGVTLTAGQEVKLAAGNGYHVIGVKSTSPAPGTSPGGGGGGSGEFTIEFTAVDAGSWRSGSGWWQSQPWASDNNKGAWFYGNKIPDTIPAHATINHVEVFVVPVYTFGSPPNFAIHNHASKPGGEPSLGAATAVGYSGAGWVTLPSSFGDALKAGGSDRGVGLLQGGYHKFASLAQDARSGTLRISYTA